MSSSLETSISEQREFEIFNGFRVIDVHLAERAAVENYVQGKANSCALHPDVCHSGCLFGQWLHGGEEKVAEHLPLFNELCGHCEDFYELATQAVLLKHIGEETAAHAILNENVKYESASTQFQDKVLMLHDKLHERYRQEE